MRQHPAYLLARNKALASRIMTLETRDKRHRHRIAGASIGLGDVTHNTAAALASPPEFIDPVSDDSVFTSWVKLLRATVSALPQHLRQEFCTESMLSCQTLWVTWRNSSKRAAFHFVGSWRTSPWPRIPQRTVTNTRYIASKTATPFRRVGVHIQSVKPMMDGLRVEGPDREERAAMLRHRMETVQDLRGLSTQIDAQLTVLDDDEETLAKVQKRVNAKLHQKQRRVQKRQGQEQDEGDTSDEDLTRQSPSELEWLWTLRNSTLLIHQLKALRVDLSDPVEGSAQGSVQPHSQLMRHDDTSHDIDDAEDEDAGIEALLATLAEEEDEDSAERQAPDHDESTHDLGASGEHPRLEITCGTALSGS
mmetsp:Transcript_22241/g.48407  ORF Transcript_22241/g.48407 Transcript_22241/m.48407 type:complete len:364 (-) Transcript_22241:177-1268(-)